MAYIIDTYNRWDRWDRIHSVYKFTINDNWYAIKEVELEWGKPILPLSIERDTHADSYFIFDSQESAMCFVRKMKSLNR